MKTIRLLNVLALLVTLAVNGLANALPLNGKLTGEISDSFPVLFTPAGYVFAIWGLIYLLLTAFAVYQALPAQRDNPRLDRIGGWFIAASLFNAAWIFLWHYEQFPLTIVAMLGLLVSLLAIYLRLEIGRSPASRAERLLVDLPFSVYLGWISVATIANAAVTLYDLGWNGGGLGPLPWTVLVILVAAGLGAAMIFLRREVAYPLVLAWAFVGIAVRQSGAPVVVVTAALGAAAMLGLLLARRRAPAPQPGVLAAAK
jgi:tryptophan-rich sensory protein